MTAQVLSLDDAVALHVRPGMHVHFGASPSRPNAAILAVAKAFRGRDPRFVLSTAEFHAMAHLLPRLRLGRTYVGCFFGDYSPGPRPNPLYSRIAAEGATIEAWSLLALCAALRAGAMGEPWAVTGALSGSSMAAALGDAFREVAVDGEPVALVRAVRPDLAFVHGVAGDADGNVILGSSRTDGVWAALAAREGVVATVERLVDRGVTRRHADRVVLPRHRVRAVCPARFGAHPEALPAPADLGLPGYGEDLAHAALWRRLATDDALFDLFCADVLDRDDLLGAWRAWVGEERLAALVAGHRPPGDVPPPEPDDIPSVVTAARRIRDRVLAEGYPLLVAGSGRPFAAARLAKRLLAVEGLAVELVVETALTDLRGVGTRFLGVLGAAQVDLAGDVNSSRAGGGKVLGASVAANDIASRAAEVVVLARADRLVPRVDFVTSPGRRVRTIVTEAGWLERVGEDWVSHPPEPALTDEERAAVDALADLA